MRALQVMRELAALSEDTVPQVGRGPGLEDMAAQKEERGG
jgi:hypothetical protein